MVICVDPEPVTSALAAAIVSTVESLLPFFMRIEPVPPAIISSNVMMRLADAETSVASSVGDSAEMVGAVVSAVVKFQYVVDVDAAAKFPTKSRNALPDHTM